MIIYFWNTSLWISHFQCHHLYQILLTKITRVVVFKFCMFKISWKGGIANKSIKTLYEGSKLSMINVCLWLCGLFHLLIIHVLLVFLNIYTNLLNHDCFKACFYKNFGLTVLCLVMGFHWTGCFCLIEALFLFSSEIFFTPIPTGFFYVPIRGGGIWGATSSPGRFSLALSEYGF